MKIKNFLITIIALALVAAFYFIGTGYLKQRQEHITLASQIADTNQALALIPIPPDDLEARLAAARARREKTKELLPGQMSSTEIVNYILKLADDEKIKAIPLVTQPWTTVQLGDYDCLVFRLNVTAKGTFAQLVSFVGKLENGELKTLVLENMSATIETEPSELGNASPGISPANASLNLAVYTQPPVFR